MPTVVSEYADAEGGTWYSLHDVLSSVLGSMELAAGLQPSRMCSGDVE